MTIIHNMIHYASRVWEKGAEIASYPLAWVGGIGLFIAEAFTGGMLVVYMVCVAAVIDLICGIAVAVSKKEFTKSHLINRTMEKLIVYGLALLVFICVDHVIEQQTGFTTDITSGLVGVIITLTETWSFLASLLILFPKNAVLRLLQKALTGEIAGKLGCEEKEVAVILSQSRKKKKQPRSKNGRFVKSK